MEAKKIPKLDYKRTSTLFFAIGLSVSLLLVTAAFEWKTYEKSHFVNLETSLNDDYNEVMGIPITEQLPPPPPKYVQPKIVEVADAIEIQEDVEIDLNIEITEDNKIKTTTSANLAFDAGLPEEKAEKVFLVVEEQPHPVGGFTAFYKYIEENLIYPEKALDNEVSGKVYVQFVVDKDGSINDVHILKGIGSGCDEEAIRVIKKVPVWEPGKQRGRAVKVRMFVPIYFKMAHR